MRPLFEKKTTTGIGYLLIVLSFAIFQLGEYYDNGKLVGGSDIFNGLFILNYLITIVFVIMLFVDKKEVEGAKRRKFKLENTTVALVLFNISAYSLNRDLVVFKESTTWLCVFLVVFNLILLLYGFKDKLPKWTQIPIVFILAMGIVFQIYQTIIIGHLSVIGLVVSWFFGISLHAWVPLCFVLVTIRQLQIYSKENKNVKWIVTVGVSVVLLILTVFTIQYTSIHRSISRSENMANSYYEEQTLPKWVAVSQKLTDSYLTEKVLKADLIYQTFEDGLWDMDSGFNDDKRLHDPLVSIADVFVDHGNDLNTQDRLRIIKSLFGYRHLTEERLWSNRYLRTKSIISRIELFPEERLSYTEYFVTVRNTASWNSNQNEAIYTFDLPEGSVVSSLSLWIEGQEEKAILSTKGLAKKAYKTIVGVERRDPSLVQWKEGNKISVRVFPCTPEEDRQFKIGITSPLTYKDQELTYNSIKIEGEHVLDAEQYIEIMNDDISLSSNNIRLDRDDEFDYEGGFNQDFSLTIKNPLEAKGEFVWKENLYKIMPPTYVEKQLDLRNVYLDLNENWNADEVTQLINTLPNTKFWVFENERIELTTKKKNKLLKRHGKKRFSLFPFHKVGESSALVLTKEKNTTPNLNELYKSAFGTDLKTLIAKNENDITVINLSNHKMDYIQSLAELSAFDYREESLSKTLEILQTGYVSIPQENENLIYIPQSKISIQKSKGKLMDKGNNHIYRLFAYEDILNRIGTSYFDESYLNQELIDLASDANIVTPLSSLIVLETQADYDRFDIKRDDDSLGNASIGNSGAVPEPHEWALIFMLVGLVVFMRYKRRQNIMGNA